MLLVGAGEKGSEDTNESGSGGATDYHAIMVKASGMHREGCVGVASN